MESKPVKTVSLKIDDSTFGETQKILSHIRISRNRYINEALEHYNKLHKRKILGKQLEEESHLVKKESMNVLKDFEKIDHAD